jgi:hypothetical protein
MTQMKQQKLTEQDYGQMVDTLLHNYPYQQFDRGDVEKRLEEVKSQDIGFDDTVFWQMVEDRVDHYWMNVHPDPTPERVLHRMQENWKIQEQILSGRDAVEQALAASLDGAGYRSGTSVIMEWISDGYAFYESLVFPYQQQIVNKLLTLAEHFGQTPEGQLLGAIAMVLELDKTTNFMKANEGFFRRVLMAAKGELHMEKEDLTYDEQEFFRKFTEISNEPDEDFPEIIH